MTLLMLEPVVAALRAQFGAEWVQDDAPDGEFVGMVASVIRASDHAHLIGDPEPGEDGVVYRCWIDVQLDDLLGADELAFEIFSVVSGEYFFTERVFDGEHVVYAFVTGSAEEGHRGRLVFAGPNTAAFLDRFRNRVTGGPRYHA